MTDDIDNKEANDPGPDESASAAPPPEINDTAQAMETNDTAQAMETNDTAQAAQTTKPVGRNDVNLEALLKVPVSLSIEVGRKKLRMDDLLNTQEGSVIELEKLLNEPLDILVNGALIAHGVIVLAQDRFGIQITDILSPEERARSL